MVTDDDVRGRPELTPAYRATREFSPDQRARPVLYTSTEPCPTCAGGAATAGPGAVVHSVSAGTNAELYGRWNSVRSAVVYGGLGSDVQVVGPASSAAGAAVHRGRLRNLNPNSNLGSASDRGEE